MNAPTIAIILTALLGAGGVAGVVGFLRLRVDKDSTVVDTVSKGLVVLERINDRLEKDLADERHARMAAEAQLAELRVHVAKFFPEQPEQETLQ